MEKRWGLSKKLIVSRVIQIEKPAVETRGLLQGLTQRGNTDVRVDILVVVDTFNVKPK